MLHNSMFVFDFMKNKVNIFFFPLTTGCISFPSGYLGPVFVFCCFLLCVCVVFCVFPPCAFHLALLSDFLSSRLRRVAAAAVVAAATVAV